MSRWLVFSLFHSLFGEDQWTDDNAQVDHMVDHVLWSCPQWTNDQRAELERVAREWVTGAVDGSNS